LADDKGRRPEEEEGDLLDDEEEDALFKARMGVVNAFLGYWKHALGVAGSVLLGAFVFGTWQNHITEQQQDIHAAVARIDRNVQKLASADGATDPLGGGFTELFRAAIAEQAVAMEAVAATSVGPGAAYAWISAADLYGAVDDDAAAVRCWSGAHALGLPGELGWAAANGHASAMAQGGDVDGAILIVEPFAAPESVGLVAEEAQLAVARFYMDAGRIDDGIETLEAFLDRFPESPMVTQVNAEIESARVAG
jgi:hypothetical protein